MGQRRAFPENRNATAVKHGSVEPNQSIKSFGTRVVFMNYFFGDAVATLWQLDYRTNCLMTVPLASVVYYAEFVTYIALLSTEKLL